MATIPPLYRNTVVRKIAKHELGHYIIARVLGFRTGDIAITIFDMNGGHEAGSEIIPAQPLACDPSIMGYLERRVTVLYAGTLAETLMNGKVNHDEAIKIVKSLGGARDYDKARELIQLWRNLKYPEAETPDEIQAGLTELDLLVWNRAADIVEQEQELIEGLAEHLAMDVKHLHRKVMLTEADLAAIPKLKERFG